MGPTEHLIVMRMLLMSFGVVVACRGDGKQPPPPAPPPAPAPAIVVDAGLDARVVAPVKPVTLACPSGATQVTQSRAGESHSGDRLTEIECQTSELLHVGPYVSFDAHGLPAEQGGYDDHGELDGPFTAFRDSHKTQEGHYTAGVMTGTWTSYYDSGKRDCVSERAKDVTVAMTCYNEAGKVIVRGKSPNGINEGLWEWFHHDDGSPSAATLYKNGDEVKNWVWKHGQRVEATSAEVQATSDYAVPEKVKKP